ncbi:MAG: UDP-N-acetylglucosamine 1-carboxyvinyltransferase, partial [Clostridia bacterium]|nr:UDP-N-acetylglucosamine 1-carboxyvinyltransferase [Clostridia bacterium]
MEKIIVCGGKPLRGSVRVQGAKNAALPILAACVLLSGVTTIENCPDLSDVRAACAILRRLGCTVERSGHTLTVDSRGVSCYTIPEAMMHEMRSSIVFLGAMLGRLGKAELCT